MFPTEALIDTSILPSDIMLLRDVKFFDFVRKEAGDAAVDLFEIQSINCVKSLLMTVDVYCIMNLKSKALDCFKNKHGFMLDDDTFIIKTGIKGNMDYLIDLLKQKCTDDAKLTKSSKRNQSSSPLDRTINRSSTTTESTMAFLSSNSSNVVTSKSLNLSLDEHKTYINNTLNNWCKNNESRLNLSNVSLIEAADNQQSFTCSDTVSDQESSSDTTPDQESSSDTTPDQESSSDTTPDQESSSDTTPDHESSSNAVLLNSTSTSITTDDHESLERPSPLLKRVYHCRIAISALSIVHTEFRPGKNGCLGLGVYFTRSIEGTIEKAEGTGSAHIIAEIYIEKVYEAERKVISRGHQKFGCGWV
ncbi:unnamed protein product [Rotaria socialis]|uniref:Uncharacterized protein n=1 Tax=Rotaria socialis TaxID=392032 RepID=A0A817V7T4_9BILA|nr:unnamed protein product [Rotaria socialis]